jgi:hypothetical protein
MRRVNHLLRRLGVKPAGRVNNSKRYLQVMEVRRSELNLALWANTCERTI